MIQIKDKEYLSIVNHILENEQFKLIDKIEHHGTSRFNHSLKVSFYSYKIAKLLKLDYIETAKGGLLHDFFISEEDRNMLDRFTSTFTHPKKAVQTSKKYFNISEKEENIIHSHMFPIYFSLPKYSESWVVSLVDKVVGSYEFSNKFKYKIAYFVNTYLFIIINR